MRIGQPFDLSRSADPHCTTKRGLRVVGNAHLDGVGMGVKIDGVKRVTDQYLQLASLTAGSKRWKPRL